MLVVLSQNDKTNIPGCREESFVRLNLSVWIANPDIAQDALGTLLPQLAQHHVQVLDTFLKQKCLKKDSAAR